MIKLYNTRTSSVDIFEPLSISTVSLYTCGPTVYSEPLIGNWVAYIRWDILVRVLKADGYDVTRVMNITDVGHLVSDADDGEDKMQKGARREGVTAWDIADRYTNRFLEGMTELNLLPPEQLPKATEHITEQIDLIKRLEDKGHTYVIEDGVYFDISTFPDYANFAHLDLEAMKAGARVEYNTQKRNPSDFALWKFSPAEQRRDMEWDSPWGKGFPGWHLECSAMAIKYLGETLDIHTGGIDHIPVHHTNEIAQSESATGKPFARYWLHANFLLVNGTKISKSLGNGYTLDDLKNKHFTPLDFKMFTLQSHYRSETNFTWENLAAAHNRLQRWKAVAVLRHQTPHGHQTETAVNTASLASYLESVKKALANDLNTPQALIAAEDGLSAVEMMDMSSLDGQAINDYFLCLDDLLGLNLISTTPDIDDSAKQLVAERQLARDSKDWARSDEIRDQLASRGIGIKDTPAGTVWFYED